MSPIAHLFFHRSLWRLAKALLVAAALGGPASLFAVPHVSLSERWEGPTRILRAEWGPPLSNVWDVHQDSEGFLWLATGRDLLRFDGVAVESVYPEGTAPIRARRFWTHRSGALWVASKDGVWKVVPSDAPRLVSGPGSGWPADAEAQSVTGNDDVVWAATRQGFCEWRNGRWKLHPRAISFVSGPYPRMVRLPDGSVWTNHAGGLLRWKAGEYRNFTSADGLPSNLVTGLTGRGGKLWVGTDAGFGSFDPAAGFTSVLDESGRPLREVYGIEEETDGSLLLTGTGLLARRLPGGTWLHLGGRVVEQLKGLHVFTDREGILWVGTWNGNLWAVGDYFSDSLTRVNGLPERRAMAVLEDRAGKIWVGSDNSQLVRWDGQHVESMNAGIEQTNQPVSALGELSDGTLLAGGAGWLKRFGGGKEEIFPACDEDGRRLTINAFCEDADSVIVGTDRGLFIFEEGEFRRLPNHETDLEGEMLALHRAGDGAVWLSTPKGLFVRRGGVWKHLTEVAPRILNFYEEADGCLWISTLGGELVRWRDGRFDRIQLDRTLVRTQISAMIGDDLGYIWMATRQGLQRVAEVDLHDAMDGRTSWFPCNVLSTRDGLIGSESTGYTHPHIYRRRNGDVLVCTTDGLMVLHPGLYRPRTVPPTMVIESLTDQNGRLLRPGGTVEPAGRDLRIRYVGISMRQGEQVVTRYRLEGYDSEWRVAGQRHLVEYTNLPAGRYTFQAEAGDAGGARGWAHSTVSFSLYIPARLWERPLFWVGAVACLAGLIGLAIRARLRVERRHAARLDKLVRERTEELQLSEERFRTLFECAPCAIFLLDPHDAAAVWRIIESNPAGYASRGFTREELLGKSFSMLFADPPAEGKYAAMLASLRERGTLQDEVRYRCKDGSEQWVAFVCVLIRIGERELVLAFDQNITERKRSETERQRAVRLDSLGVLAGGIAHDFNNLLTVILANLSLAREDVAKDSELSEFLDAAQLGCTRAHQLATQLLTFAKGGKPVRRLTSVKKLLSEVASFSVSGSNCRLDLDVSADLWPAEIDETQMSQVLQNLFINARQAMPQGGTIRVTARNVDEEGARRVRIHVRDYGPGIPPDVLARIFEPYFTTKSTGSGLGLATSYSIVQAHGGELRVQSWVGYGAEFILTLPAAEGAPEVSGPTGAANLRRGSGCVLVMDDDELVRRIVVQALKTAGYEVLDAPDGDTALGVWQKHRESGRRIDLGLFDLTVPGQMGGSALLEELRRRGAMFPVLVMSGYSKSNELANPQRHGFVAALAKPFTAAQLQAAVSAEIRKKTSLPAEPLS